MTLTLLSPMTNKRLRVEDDKMKLKKELMTRMTMRIDAKSQKKHNPLLSTELRRLIFKQLKRKLKKSRS